MALEKPFKVELRNVGMKYVSMDGETEALKAVNFSITEGEFLSIVGPSGCGKSTLLSIISGLIQPTSGEVFVDGRPLTHASYKTGYMLQADYLFEWRTVWQNVMLGLEVRNELTKENKERVEKLLQDYGLFEFRHRYPQDLSGGMRQRVALIRTLAIDPEILLLDEPFSALDYQTRLFLEEEMTNILRASGKTVILVTHDISEAISMADRVAVLSRRPATIKSIFDIQLTCVQHTPLKTREAPEFRAYFKAIWEELDIHV
jgi:NitT/TauT family transport system ATP-binding protein